MTVGRVRKHLLEEGKSEHWTIFEELVLAPLIPGRVPKSPGEILAMFPGETPGFLDNRMTTVKRVFRRILPALIPADPTEHLTPSDASRNYWTSSRPRARAVSGWPSSWPGAGPGLIDRLLARPGGRGPASRNPPRETSIRTSCGSSSGSGGRCPWTDISRTWIGSVRPWPAPSDGRVPDPPGSAARRGPLQPEDADGGHPGLPAIPPEELTGSARGSRRSPSASIDRLRRAARSGAMPPAASRPRCRSRWPRSSTTSPGPWR